jgi:hypothetical protein
MSIELTKQSYVSRIWFARNPGSVMMAMLYKESAAAQWAISGRKRELINGETQVGADENNWFRIDNTNGVREEIAIKESREMAHALAASKGFADPPEEVNVSGGICRLIALAEEHEWIDMRLFEKIAEDPPQEAWTERN